jgi:pilus assembly protein FimV
LDDLGSLEDIDLGDLDIDQDQTLDDRKARQGQTPPDRSSKRDSSVSSNLLSSGVEEDDIPSISLDDLEFDESELGDESENASLSGLMDGADHSEEVETKLDLARAYIEMGDGDGAKEILAEVVSEGSEKQKNEARELMEQID